MEVFPHTYKAPLSFLFVVPFVGIRTGDFNILNIDKWGQYSIPTNATPRWSSVKELSYYPSKYFRSIFN